MISAVVVPDRAFVLDWVFADGPPQQAVIFDNNNFQDFHAVVPKSIPEELYWVEEEQRILRRLQTERRSREAAMRAKVIFGSIIRKYGINIIIIVLCFQFSSFFW